MPCRVYGCSFRVSDKNLKDFLSYSGSKLSVSVHARIERKQNSVHARSSETKQVVLMTKFVLAHMYDGGKVLKIKICISCKQSLYRYDDTTHRQYYEKRSFYIQSDVFYSSCGFFLLRFIRFPIYGFILFDIEKDIKALSFSRFLNLF